MLQLSTSWVTVVLQVEAMLMQRIYQEILSQCTIAVCQKFILQLGHAGTLFSFACSALMPSTLVLIPSSLLFLPPPITSSDVALFLIEQS